MSQEERTWISRRGLLANGTALAFVPTVLASRAPTQWLGALASRAVTVGYWAVSRRLDDLSGALRPYRPPHEDDGTVAPPREPLDDRVVDARTLSSRIPFSGTASIAVERCGGLAPHTDLATATLHVAFPRPDGTATLVHAWSSSGARPQSVSGGCEMLVPLDRSGRLPLTLELERPPGLLARRLSRALRGDAAERVAHREPLDVPLRRGVYVVAGRGPTGRLPAWSGCGFRPVEENGAPVLVRRGGGDREVDFPYLVLSLAEGGAR